MEDKFKYRVAQVMAGEYMEFDTVPVCATPQLIQDIGFSNGEIVMTQKHIRNCLAPEETSTDKEHHHDLPIDFMDNLPQYIEKPTMILSSLTQPDSAVVVTDCKDKKDRPIIVALKNDGTGRSSGRLISCNILMSAYGRNGFEDFLNNSIRQNALLYYDEKKSRDLVVSAGLQLPRVLAKYDSNVIIRRYNENVNPMPQNNSDFLPDGYGTTLERSDGKPFAYADPDGRQKTFEYTKTLKGDIVLRSTAATFSGGRSEITEYDESGVVIGIERKDAAGKTTYKYSSDGMGYYDREESIEYFDVNTRYAVNPHKHKSVHEKEHNKENQRGIYYDNYKEKWHEYDSRGERTLFKHNEYKADGMTADKYYCEERRYEYDSYGSCTLSVEKDYSGTHVTKTTYYTDIDDEHPVKSRTHCYADGSFSKCEYDISGEYTEVEMSADGKLTAYRGKDGVRHVGQAAQHAYRKSVDVLAQSASAIRQSATSENKNTKINNGKPTGNGSSGR